MSPIGYTTNNSKLTIYIIIHGTRWHTEN